MDNQESNAIGSGIDIFLIAILFLMLAFLPAIFIAAGFFTVTYFSSYNRRWWLGLAAWGAGMLYVHYLGPGIWPAYQIYFSGLGAVICNNLGDEVSVMLPDFWRSNIYFVLLNGCFVGGLVSAKYYFVGFDLRDLRQQRKRGWKKSLGWWGPSYKQVKSKPARKLSSLAHPAGGQS